MKNTKQIVLVIIFCLSTLVFIISVKSVLDGTKDFEASSILIIPSATIMAATLLIPMLIKQRLRRKNLIEKYRQEIRESQTMK